MPLIDDWKSYMRGEVDLDESHFVGLFKDCPTEPYIRDALKDVAAGDQIAERLIEVIEQNDSAGFEYVIPAEKNFLSAAELEPLVAKAVAERKAFLLSTGRRDLASEINERTLTFRSSFAGVEALRADDNLPMAEVEDVVGDAFLAKIGATELDYVYGLLEAVIYISLVPAVTRYVLDPLVKFGLDVSSDYACWRGGGLYVIADEQVVYSVHTAA